MKSLWLYLHFPQLQLDSLLSQQQGIQNSTPPMVVLEAQQNKVLQLNQQAKDAGVNSNMGLATAAALCRELQVIPYQAEVEQNKLREIAQWLYLLTCDMSFYPPNGLLLRIHNMLHLYGGLDTYWQSIKNHLASLELVYQYATAHTPFAARMLARRGENLISDDVNIFKQALGRCRLSDTELDVKTVQKLQRVGVNSVADLLAIPLQDLAKRFDSELVTYLGRLSGTFQHPQVFFHPPKVFSRYLELLYEIDNKHLLLHPMKLLLRALEQFLKLRDQVTNQLHITLHQRDQEDLSLQLGSGQGEYQATTWLNLLSLRLENVQLQAPVFALTLNCAQTRLRCADKLDLFEGNKGSLSHLQLVALLQARLGEQAIQSPHLLDDFRPEIASSCGTPLSDPAQPSILQGLRPSFLLAQPQRLIEKVSLLQGPERIVSGWWDKQPTVRDYFIARSGRGSWYWVFKTPDNCWYLHGVFS
jgi:protein ImuB